jgi:hemerythrin superfamily protein
MPSTTINLNQKVYDQQGNPVKETNETVNSVLQKLSKMNVSPYERGDQLANDLAKKLSLKEQKLQDYLKDLALFRHEKEANIEDFDLYLDLRNANSKIELDDKKIEKLKEKLLKSGLSNLIIGQIYYMLKGMENPLKK